MAKKGAENPDSDLHILTTGNNALWALTSTYYMSCIPHSPVERSVSQRPLPDFFFVELRMNST